MSDNVADRDTTSPNQETRQKDQSTSEQEISLAAGGPGLTSQELQLIE